MQQPHNCRRQWLSFPFPFFHLVLDSAKFMLLMKKGHGRALKILQLGLWFTIQHTYKNFLLIMLKFLLSNISCLKYHLSKIFHLKGKISLFKVDPKYIEGRGPNWYAWNWLSAFFFHGPLTKLSNLTIQILT